eukprot:gene34396-44131_t
MGYRRFVGLVAASRHQSPEAIDKIAQGRIWDGGTARQIGLVDEFGDMDQALAWVAHRLGAAKYHPVFLGDVADGFAGFLQQVFDDDSEGDTHDDSAHDLFGRVSLAQSALAGQLAADLGRLLGGHGAQAYCLECAGLATPAGDTVAIGCYRGVARLSPDAGVAELVDALDLEPPATARLHTVERDNTPALMWAGFDTRKLDLTEMQIVETSNEGLKRAYTVTIAASDIAARIEGEVNRIAPQVRMPGFRPGKVPTNLVRKLH